MEIRNKAFKMTTTSLLIAGLFLVDQTTPTQTPAAPTLAPSKTAVSNATEEPPNNHQTPSPGKPISVNTQADLNILTGNVQRPNGLIWANGKLYISCNGDWTLYEMDPSTSTTIPYLYGVKNAYSLYEESINNQSHLWIPDYQSNTLVHVFQGKTETIASNLSGPWGITKINEKTFIISNLSGNSIVAIQNTGEIQELVIDLKSPTGLTSDQANIYIANTGSTRRSIEWYTQAELLTTEIPIRSGTTENHSLITGLQNTTNIIVGPDQLLYFTFALGTRGVVGRVNPQTCIIKGGCTSSEVEIIVYTELAAPLAGLTISPDMKLYVHSIFSPDIYWVQLATEEKEE